MYPDLSYILHALIDTNPDNWTSIVKTFGLMLVIAILSSAWVLYLELKRKEEEGLLHAVPTKVITGKPATPIELIVNAIIGFVLGFKILYIFSNFAEFQADASSVLLSSKGVLIGGIIGSIIGTGLKYWEKNKDKLDEPKEEIINIYPHDRIGDITIVGALAGIIGAKIFAVVEDLDALFADPIGVLFSGSGMAIYGGLIVGFIAGYAYVKSLGIKPIHVLDGVGPALIVGAGVGRMGCQLAGDGCWGIVNNSPQPSWWFLPDWAWSFTYPNNVINEGAPIADCRWLYCRELTEGVYPTPLIEMLMFAIIFAILWSLRKRIKIPGFIFFLYLSFNGLERFLIEKIRVNDRYEILGFQSTQAEFIAVILFMIGIIGCLVLWQRSKTRQVEPV